MALGKSLTSAAGLDAYRSTPPMSSPEFREREVFRSLRCFAQCMSRSTKRTIHGLSPGGLQDQYSFSS